MSAPPTWTRPLFTGAGVLIVALGIIHLAVVPMFLRWFVAVGDPGPLRVAAVVLNHVVVGVLLLPLGALTIYAARALPTGARWAQVVCLAAAGTVLTLPVAVIALMGRDHLHAWPFALAVGVMTVAAALLVVGALAGLRRRA